RFIEQQKFCPRGHCNGHAQQALLAIRQRPALLLGAMRETDEVKQLPNLILEVLLFAPEAWQRQNGVKERGFALQMQACQDIVENRFVGEQAGALKRTHQSHGRNFVRAMLGKRDTLEMQGALGWPQKTGYHVEGSGLARSVGADQAQEFTLVKVERHIRDGDQAAKMHGDVLDLEQRRAVTVRAHASAPLVLSVLPSCGVVTRASRVWASCLRVGTSSPEPNLRSQRRCTAGTIPWGRNITISTMAMPYTIHWTSGPATSRRPTGRMPKMIPPMMGPIKVPLPPVITMITIVTV